MFTTIEEVREYLSGDRVVCLLCDRSFRHLARHLRGSHPDVDPRAYRLRFGIPLGLGLLARDLSEGARARLLARYAEGYRPPALDHGDPILKARCAEGTRESYSMPVRHQAQRQAFDRQSKVVIVGDCERCGAHFRKVVIRREQAHATLCTRCLKAAFDVGYYQRRRTAGLAR